MLGPLFCALNKPAEGGPRVSRRADQPLPPAGCIGVDDQQAHPGKFSRQLAELPDQGVMKHLLINVSRTLFRHAREPLSRHSSAEGRPSCTFRRFLLLLQMGRRE